MRLLRYGPVGKELPSILDLQGHIRSLATIIPDITLEVVTPGSEPWNMTAAMTATGKSLPEVNDCNASNPDHGQS